MEETRRRGRAHHVRDRVRGRIGIPEPGRCAGARLCGRFRAVDARRRRNGPGIAHEDDPSGQPSPERARGIRARQGDQHGQGGEHVADGSQFQFGSQRDGRSRERIARFTGPSTVRFSTSASLDLLKKLRGGRKTKH